MAGAESVDNRALISSNRPEGGSTETSCSATSRGKPSTGRAWLLGEQPAARWLPVPSHWFGIGSAHAVDWRALGLQGAAKSQVRIPFRGALGLDSRRAKVARR